MHVYQELFLNLLRSQIRNPVRRSTQKALSVQINGGTFSRLDIYLGQGLILLLEYLRSLYNRYILLVI